MRFRFRRPTWSYIARRDIPGIVFSAVLVVGVFAALLWRPGGFAVDVPFPGPGWQCYYVFRGSFCIKSIYPPGHARSELHAR
jgi:hypothetical protein